MAASMMAAALFLVPSDWARASLATPPGKKQEANKKPSENKPQTRPVIQIALLLDTSSSMNGLIEQAKTRLWEVVNELGSAQKSGQAPLLQIALYEYGNSGLNAANGYIRQVLPLSEELDRVSEELFALRTNGGDEYCGQAIDTALRELEWSNSDDSLKLIFIAGNESFYQGPVDARQIAAQTTNLGIRINTIYCGHQNASDANSWQTGAKLALGQFMTINQNQRIAHINAPQDKEITALNQELNQTYIPFGAQGASGAQRQMTQDQNASSSGHGAATRRAISKSTGYYSNSSWELGDALKNKKLRLSAVKKSQLPEVMRGMNDTQRKAYVEKKMNRRKQIQKRIQKLSKERSSFVATARKQQLTKQKNKSLDQAMAEAIRTQAQELGYNFQ